MEVFQVSEEAETLRIKKKMLIQHLVPEHRDHHIVCGTNHEGNFCGNLLKWFWNLIFSNLILQVEVREAEGVTGKPRSG